MLRNTFTKTLYERRWSTLLWFVSISGFVLLIVLLFPSLRDSFGEALSEIPESMQGLLGDVNAYQTISGYVDLQVIAQMVFLTIIMAVIAGTALIAGEEKNRTLQSLLAQPVSRTYVYLQKLGALVITTIVACAGLYAGTALGLLIIGESLDMLRLLQATLMTWLLTFFFAAMAYSIGAMSGKKGIAGVITGFYAFAAYMLTALAGLAPVLEKLNYVSPFYYFNTPSVLANGLDFGNLALLGSVSVIFLIVGLLIFQRRDIAN